MTVTRTCLSHSLKLDIRSACIHYAVCPLDHSIVHHSHSHGDSYSHDYNHDYTLKAASSCPLHAGIHSHCIHNQRRYDII